MNQPVAIVGAGLAGLACALRLAEAGIAVTVYEAAPHPGGRCRSFHDPHLDRIIDTGSHLALSGNKNLRDYLKRCGADDRMVAVRPAAFPFVDLRDGSAWTLRPGGLWPFDPRRRVPGGGAVAHLAAVKLLLASAGATVADALPPGGPLYDRLWAPLAVSVLNGAPERVSARLMAAVLRQTLLRGEAACRPLVAPQGLSHALVEPAVARLAALGAALRCGERVERLMIENGRVIGVTAGGREQAAGTVVLAVPPWAAAVLVPGLPVPAAGPPIVNAHFRLPTGMALPGNHPLLGLVGGTAEWLFQRGDVLSVTVSNAGTLAGQAAGVIAGRLWDDAAAALAVDWPLPPWRVIKERRATFDQTPACESLRPGPHGPFAGLIIAGDWTATGLPATMEGAIASGSAAADAIFRPAYGAKQHS